jgi:hypothetical protein
MTLAIKELSAAGVAITDEIVVCDEAHVISGTTYYRGYLANVPNHSIGETGAYGLWTGAGKTGTRQTVSLAGYPTSGTTARVDTRNGWVWTTASRTVYANYLAHEPIRHNPCAVEVYVPWRLTSAAAMTIAVIKPAAFSKYGYARVSVEGGAPSADATLTVSNGTTSKNITVPQAGGASVVEFDAPLKCTTAQSLTLATADGKGAFSIRIGLIDV